MKNFKYNPWSMHAKHSPVGIVTDVEYLDAQKLSESGTSIIPFGKGRSYGDVCMNNQGFLFDSESLDGIDFDNISGMVRCGAGVTLKQILDKTVPCGWMLPVVPGTKEVTVGGAIANDIHGKNHHRMGSFGNHVESFTLCTSYGKQIVCSPDTNFDLFQATIGGLGLTGLITSATIKLMKISSPYMHVRNIPFNSISEFIELSHKYDEEFLYSVGWLNVSQKLGSGILQLGNHSESSRVEHDYKKAKQVKVPQFFRIPGVINKFTVRMINSLYAKLNSKDSGSKYYDAFLFPLDGLPSWNKIFFPKGFLQYQCLVPYPNASVALDEILRIAETSGSLSFLNVIKIFGTHSSLGKMSFPQEGVTMSLDFFKINSELFELLDDMDAIIFDNGGKIYPAKDFRMNSQYFGSNFPKYREFEKFIDPVFSSNYWRRVNNE